MTAKFISYQKVENQSFKGIVTISYKGLILKFKLIPLKTGTEHFCAPISFKMGDGYCQAFETEDPKELKSLQVFALEETKKNLRSPPPKPVESDKYPYFL